MFLLRILMTSIKEERKFNNLTKSIFAPRKVKIPKMLDQGLPL